jgi:hypothetical protein
MACLPFGWSNRTGHVGCAAVGASFFAAEFDAAKRVVSGVVTKVEWMNPHTYFYVDVKDAQTGKVENWACEMGSPNGLTRQGWTRASYKPGDAVKLVGHPMKDGSKGISLFYAIKPDGTSEGVTPTSVEGFATKPIRSVSCFGDLCAAI